MVHKCIERMLGPHHAVLFDRAVDLGFLAESGGVDQDRADGFLVGAFELKFDVDGVARGAGDVAHDHAVLSDQAVHEGGFADVIPLSVYYCLCQKTMGKWFKEAAEREELKRFKELELTKALG